MLTRSADRVIALWADSAYSGAPIAKRLKGFALPSMICVNGHVNSALLSSDKVAALAVALSSD